jgi:hypothetical protein
LACRETNATNGNVVASRTWAAVDTNQSNPLVRYFALYQCHVIKIVNPTASQVANRKTHPGP